MEEGRLPRKIYKNATHNPLNDPKFQAQPKGAKTRSWRGAA